MLTYESPHTGEETIVKNGQTHTYLSNKFPIRQPDGSLALGGISIDITDRRKAEEALRKTEEKYHDLFAQSPEDIYVLALDGKILEFNRATTLAGNPHEEVVGKNVLDLKGFEDAKTQFADILQGNTEPFEYSIKSRAGENIWVEVHPAIVLDGDNKTIRLTAMNISARKIAEEQLKLSNAAIERATVGIIITDANQPDNPIIFTNEAFCKISGYSPEELLGVNCRFLQGKDTDKNTIAEIRKCIAQKINFEGEILNYRKDGTIFWNFLRISPVFNKNGNCTHFTAVQMDITVRKVMESALQESERFTKATLDALSTNIAILDESGTILAVNRAWREFAESNSSAPHELVHVGINYLSVCQTSGGPNSEEAPAMAAGIQAVMSGERKDFSLEYPCHSPTERRWFNARVTRFLGQGDLRVVVAHENITERILAEEKLRNHETILNLIIDTAPQTIFWKDLEGRYLGSNRAFAANTGFDPAEVIGKTDFDLPWPREEAEAYRAADREVIETNSPKLHIVGQLQQIDGSQRWIDTSKAPLRDAKGQPFAVLGISEDITERILGEEKLRQLSRAIESSPNSMLIVDMDGIIQYANPKFTELTGYAPEEALGKRTQILSLEYTPLETREALQAAVLAGSKWSGELCKRKKNGELYWEHAFMSPIKNEKGEITHYVGMSEDITEYRLIQAEIVLQNEYLSSLQDITLDLLDRQTSETLFTTIVERAASLMRAQHGAIFISEGDDLVIRSATKGFAHRIGSREVKPGTGSLGRIWQNRKPEIVENYDEWELRDKSFDNENLNAIAGVPIFVNGDIIGVLEVARTKKDRSLFTSVEIEILTRLASLVSLVMDNSNLYESALKEIKEREQAQESLMLAHDQAVKANQLKSQLIAKVSHELRTPLSSVLGFAELLKYSILGGELNPEQMEAADQIIDSAHYLTDMVNEFLDEAEIESHSLILEHKPFVLADILKHANSTMSMIANKKGLELKTYLAPDLPETLWGDARRLQQILINLTNNAIKFTRMGEVSINMRHHAQHQWAIEVKDSGVGIPKDAQEMIFEPFKQMDNAITRENQGTGLGLTITKQLVELMNGRIFVESEVGKGSTFTIILPIRSNPESQ